MPTTLITNMSSMLNKKQTNRHRYDYNFTKQFQRIAQANMS